VVVEVVFFVELRIGLVVVVEMSGILVELGLWPWARLARGRALGGFG
jgi:hypothetical protein